MASPSAIQFFLKDQSEDASPGIVFDKLSVADENQLGNACKGLDLDYLLLSEKCDKLLDIPEVHDFLRVYSAKFNAYPEYASIYSATVKSAFVLGMIGQHHFGVPFDGVAEGDKDETEMMQTSLYRNLAAQMEGIHRDHMPFIEFSSTLRANFGSYNIVIFAYGQKSPIAEVQDNVQSFVGKCKVEVAVASEYHISQTFFCALHDDRLSKFAFSNFLSNVGVNYRINDGIIASSFAKGAFRCIVYNSFQHQKKHTKYTIKRTNIAKGDNVGFNDILFRLFEFFRGSISQIQNLTNVIDGNSLRIEGYFVLSENFSISDAKNSILAAFRKFKYVSTENRAVVNFIQKNSSFLRRLLDECHRLPSNQAAVFFFFVYERYLSAIFTLSHSNSSFRAENFGIGIPIRYFELSTFSFTLELWNSYSGVRIWKILDTLLGTSQSLYEVKLALFSSIFHTAAGIQSPERIYTFFYAKILFLLRKISTAASQKYITSAELEKVNLHKWLSILQLKKKKDVFLNIFLGNFSGLQTTFTNSYSYFIDKLMDEELFIYFQSKLVCFKYQNSFSLRILEFDGLKDIVSAYSFEDFLLLVNGSALFKDDKQVEDLLFFDSFREQVHQDFLSVCERADEHWDFVCDNDLLVRCIFAELPSNTVSQPSFFFSILDLCPKFKDYVRFISLTVFKSLCVATKNKRFLKDFENHTKTFKEIIPYKKLTTQQVMFCLGTFSNPRKVNVVGKRIKTEFTKAVISSFLMLHERYDLLNSGGSQRRRQSVNDEVASAVEEFDNVDYQENEVLDIPVFSPEELDSSDLDITSFSPQSQVAPFSRSLPQSANSAQSDDELPSVPLPLQHLLPPPAPQPPLRLVIPRIRLSAPAPQPLPPYASEDTPQTQSLFSSPENDLDEYNNSSTAELTANTFDRSCPKAFIEKVKSNTVFAEHVATIEGLLLTAEFLDSLTVAELREMLKEILRGISNATCFVYANVLKNMFA